MRSPTLTPHSNRAILAITTQLSLQNSTLITYILKLIIPTTNVEAEVGDFKVYESSASMFVVGMISFRMKVIRVLFCRLSCVVIRLQNNRIFCERKRQGKILFKQKVWSECRNGEGEWGEARALHTRGSCLRSFAPSENGRKRVFCSQCCDR